MKSYMMKRLWLLLLIITVLSAGGCVKDTLDTDMLSMKVHLSPTIAIAAIKGDVSLGDAVKANDTIIYDQDNFVRIVFKEDSIIDMKLKDFYDLNDMVSYTQIYKMGELAISPFSSTMSFTLNQISLKFSPALRNQFVALNDGLNHPFPAFPSTDLGESPFTAFTNFQNAVFKSGFLDISVKNNLTAPLNSINLTLYNVTGHTPVTSAITIPAVAPGQTQTVSVNMADKTVTNSLSAAIVLSGSSGNATPVKIDLANSNIQVTVAGRDLKVKSGRVILPAQTIETLDKKDTITFDPGSGVEVDEIKSISGAFTYRIQSSCPLKASLDFKLPTALRSGSPLAELITILPNSIQTGSISVNNTLFNLSSVTTHPYNMLPLQYNFSVSSDGQMVNFNSTDQISVELKLSNPDLDYVKGYFGQKTEVLDPDSIDLEISDILKRLTGTFSIISPSIKVNYSNSFAVPIEISLNVTGRRGTSKVGLGLAPILLASPVAPASRDINGSFTVNKTNSSLPALISLPPEVISFSGSAKMNPSGVNTLRNNYVFGNSRFIGSAEIEVPLEFRINNLQFTDTLDNFLRDDSGSGENSFSPGDLDMLRVELFVSNGFPLGVSVSMSLYDEATKKVKSTINGQNILEPAPVGTNGRANGVTETSTSLLFSKAFFDSIDSSDKVIFKFTLNTTNGGGKDVKIYSDYRIAFNAAFVVKPDINLK
jgi:hypothetical protein